MEYTGIFQNADSADFNVAILRIIKKNALPITARLQIVCYG